MKRQTSVLCCFVAIAFIVMNPVPVLACGLDSVFRSYLDRSFWQPFSRFEGSLGHKIEQDRRLSDGPFAGMGKNTVHPALQAIRDAYRQLDYKKCRNAIQAALVANLNEEEKEELSLIDAKIDMREGESNKPELLTRAKEKFRVFLDNSKNTFLKSEARGWLGHIHYIRGEYSSAAKIYLDELWAKDSVFTRGSLVASLRTLFPYNGSSSRLFDHLDEYFDTPVHALFVVNIITNPVYSDGEERKLMAEAAKKTLSSLQKHEELFRSGIDADALALALMRASLYMGDTDAALAYSRLIPEKSATFCRPDYNWMVAVCHFLKREYESAEMPLLRIYDSMEANYREKNAAAQGLIGVYQKLHRPIDQLHAAFLYYQLEHGYPYGEYDNESCPAEYIGFTYWPYCGWSFDLPYLLDVQLTDQDLEGYLNRYSIEGKAISLKLPNFSRRRSACEIVEYALAVRYARKEKYEKSAGIYKKLGAWPRAKRMQKLVTLYAQAHNVALRPGLRYAAQYDYAVFLSKHSTQIFFNDMLWYGYQRYAFMGESSDEPVSMESPTGHGLTGEERDFLLKQERRVKDEQEERWRALKIFSRIVAQAGPSELGMRSAKEALLCLANINRDRFGREAEIKKAEDKLWKWLRKSKKMR